MQVEDFNRRLTDPGFLSSLHRLLWFDPFTNRGVWDAGWNCRDHAFIIGALAALRGWPVALAHGKAFFAKSKDQRGWDISPHSWVRVGPYGSYDLSVRLSGGRGPKWDDWERVALVAGKFAPGGQTQFMSTTDARKFAAATAVATHEQDGQFAIYWLERVDVFGSEIVERSMKWIDSPLTMSLKKQLPGRSDLYCKAVLYFDDLLNEKVAPLHESGPSIALWRHLSGRYGQAKNELIERIQQNPPLAPSS